MPVTLSDWHEERPSFCTFITDLRAIHLHIGKALLT